MKEISEKIDQLLTRRVVEVLPSRELFRQELKSGKKISLYIGVDPSSPIIHIGHAVALKKLREFQELGHHVILLIGDFTGRIGDPSGRTVERKPLTHPEVLENAKTYKEQAAKILDFNGKNPVEIKFNGEWLDKLTFKDVIQVAAHFTVQQMIERDMFQTRLAEGKPIGLHEFLYPLMQGYDSVAMNVDLEVGGTDQTFNMMAGRALMSNFRHKEKFVLTVPLLEGLDGRKMSKSYGNVIGLDEKPEEMYGKVMSLKDELIIKYFDLVTDVPQEEVAKMATQLKLEAVNPMELKKNLAFQIVKEFHSEEEAKKASAEFEKVFQKSEVPTEIAEVEIKKEKLSLIDLLIETKLSISRSEARRLIEQGGVEVNQKKIINPFEEISVEPGLVLRAGKRNFVRVLK
ncbi:MAG: tyrosine--tRNA ligase [Patescibacteria group bacterium]|nr:tyrosine--tRNA ligase [Patescibacteria group bacterium]